MKRRHSVSDEEWVRIEPLLPPPKKTECPRKDTRELVDAVLWIFKTGASWRDLPEYFGPLKTAYNNFVRWRDASVWEGLLKNLNAEPERPWQIMIDSTIVKAHQHSAGAKKGVITIKLWGDPGED